MEHRRDHVRVRHPVLADETQRLLGVPPLHQHERRAAVQGRVHRQQQRCGVVQRAGHEVHRAGPVAREPRLGEGRGRVRGRSGDTLRTPGRARRVEHDRPAPRIRDRRPGLRRERRLVVVPAGERRPDRDPDRYRVPDGREIGEVAVEHDRPRAAVAHDVGGLLEAEVPVDRREPPSGALGGRVGLDPLRPVRGDQRDGVAGPEPACPQGPDEPVHPGVELGVREGRTVGDDRGPVGDRRREPGDDPPFRRGGRDRVRRRAGVGATGGRGSRHASDATDRLPCAHVARNATTISGSTTRRIGGSASSRALR